MPKHSTETEKPVKRKRIAVVPCTPKPYEIPGFPIADGPQKSARKLTERKEQPVVIVIPAGVFQYVWEMLESKARVDHQKYGAVPSIALAAEEAVAAFRRANADAVKRSSRRVKKKK